MSTSKPPSAAALIAARTRTAPAVPSEVIAELVKLCEYNDRVGNRSARIGRETVIPWLREHGIEVGSEGLDRIAREHLGRRSWAQK
jgi:hypothetical protein